MPVRIEERALPPLSLPRARPDAALLWDGRVAVVGGNTRPSSSPRTGACEIECRSSAAVDVIDLRRWTTTPTRPLVEPRESASLIVSPRGLLVAGGVADFA